MLLEYKAVSGQSVYDVCTTLYGSLDLLTKLCVDSGLSDMDTPDLSGYTFLYDPLLNKNQTITASVAGKVYGTNYLPEPQPFICPLVTSVANTGSTDTTLSFSWVSGGVYTYQFAINDTGDTPTTGAPISATTVTVIGLDSGTVYYFFVRTACTDGSFSAWSSVSAATTPALFLFRAGRDSSGDFKPYAVKLFRIIKDGVTEIPIITTVIKTELAETSFVDTYLAGVATANSLTGVFSIDVDGNCIYTRGLGEDIELVDPFVTVLTKYIIGSYETTTTGGIIGFSYNGNGSIHIIDWSDFSLPNAELAISTTSALTTITHEYDLFYGAGIDVWIFHNDIPNTYLFGTISGSTAYLNNININSNLPTSCRYLYILANSNYTANSINTLGDTPSLQTMLITNNGALEEFTGDLFTGSMPMLQAVSFANSSLTSATCDALINNFFANSYTGMPLLTNFSIGTQTGGGTFTAASLAARNAMSATGTVFS